MVRRASVGLQQVVQKARVARQLRVAAQAATGDDRAQFRERVGELEGELEHPAPGEELDQDDPPALRPC